MKRYLVTGGTGFLGSALVLDLLDQGHEVRVLDNNSRGRSRRLGDGADQVHFIEADLRDETAVRSACEGIDSVCHLGYINGTEFFYSMPEQVLEVAVSGMMNVLNGCIHHGVPELVLASSSEVYQTPPQVPTDEAVPLSVPDPHNPRYSYGGGKIISELLALNYGRTHFERVLIFRPHNVYGPDMGWEHVIPEFSVRMAQLEQLHPKGDVPFPIQGSGRETRSFIYIDDFTRGLRAILNGGEHLGIYNVGTEDERSIADVAGTVAGSFGRSIELIPGPAKPGATPRRCPDVRRLRALGWEPVVSFEEGVRQSAIWYADNLELAPTDRLR